MKWQDRNLPRAHGSTFGKGKRPPLNLAGVGGVLTVAATLLLILRTMFQDEESP